MTPSNEQADGLQQLGSSRAADARPTPALSTRAQRTRRASTTANRPRAEKQPAADRPVARIAVDVALPHLDRLFDYLVPQPLADLAAPGTRVRVRFAGQLVDGFVIDRVAETEHEGRLAFIERSVSGEVVLTRDVYALARATADRWAGTLADVLRLAVPPRHARVEVQKPEPAHTADAADIVGPAAPWEGYRSGQQLVAALRGGLPARAVWAALPGPGWPDEVAALVAASVAAGRGALVVVPDGRDAGRVDVALSACLSPGGHVVLTADLGPAERYRRFLAISRGDVGVVVGTRAAAFAPVRDLGLVVVWDDGDDLHAEPRAPYPHAREVLALRAHLAGAAAVIGGHAVTAEGARLVSTGWAKLVDAVRPEIRRRAPRVSVGDDPAAAPRPSAGGRLPTTAWEAAHDALEADRPVLVQVPRRGYLAALSCNNCRAPLRCPTCAGPLGASAVGAPPSCRWCGRLAVGSSQWRCPECGATRFRAGVVGASRTAEELGRAFPGVAVRTSSQGQVLDRVGAGASLVIATPGAEPAAEGGYGAAVLLDGWALLSRADLRAGEEALRRWLNAAALVRPAAAGGRVVVLADSSLRAVQALVRWDPTGHAERELAERSALGFPPAVAFAELVGDAAAVDELITASHLPEPAEILGPVPVAIAGAASNRRADDGDVRVLIRVPRAQSAALAAALHQAQGVRSARKSAAVRVRIDPADLG
jgi:primosomal protein N' (replication factor Y) (superfamily II helicase)